MCYNSFLFIFGSNLCHQDILFKKLIKTSNSLFLLGMDEKIEFQWLFNSLALCSKLHGGGVDVISAHISSPNSARKPPSNTNGNISVRVSITLVTHSVTFSTDKLVGWFAYDAYLCSFAEPSLIPLPLTKSFPIVLGFSAKPYFGAITFCTMCEGTPYKCASCTSICPMFRTFPPLPLHTFRSDLKYPAENHDCMEA